MKVPAVIRITKIAAIPGKEAVTSEWNDYKAQGGNKKGPPIKYCVEGDLQQDIEVGKSIKINNPQCNGIPMADTFETTPLVELEGNLAKTLNSIYLIEQL